MRLFQLQPARPQWYDRNPLNVANNASQNAIAPAGTTTRWTYTVPANRKAIIETCAAVCYRNTVAAPIGTFGPNAQVVNTNSGTPFCTAQLGPKNVVGDQVTASIGAAATLLAGQSMTGSTFDDSTGGTCSFQTNFKGTEFDA